VQDNPKLEDFSCARLSRLLHAPMGQEMARRRDAAMTDMRSNLSSGGSSASPAQRQRIEELNADVHEARQENDRLSNQISKLRVKLQVLTEPDPFKRADAIEEGVPAALEQGLNDDMHQLRRVLEDLKRENKALKDENARNPESKKGTKDEGGKSGGGVGMAEYRSLQHQVLDLRKAYESAVAQTERLRARKASREGSPKYQRGPWTPSPLAGRSSSMDDDRGVEGSPEVRGRRHRSRGGSVNSDYTGSVGRSRGGSMDSEIHGPTRLSHTNSLDEDYGGRLSMYGSMPNSGTSTPAVGGSRGSHGSPLSAEGGDISKKLQAIQAENDKLKQKIRMLASN